MLHERSHFPGRRDSIPFSRRAKLRRVVIDNFFEGFIEGVQGGRPAPVLEYSSTSGLYFYNPVREIAHRAGFALAVEMQNSAKEDRFRLSQPYKIPASVWAECEAEMRNK